MGWVAQGEENQRALQMSGSQEGRDFFKASRKIDSDAVVEMANVGKILQPGRPSN